MNALWFGALSDLFINLSAGWFGAAYGVLFLADQGISIKIGLLTVNVFLAIVCLLFAVWLRGRTKK